MPSFWQFFTAPPEQGGPWHEHFPAIMPDGSTLVLPLRDMGSFAVAGLIANQASFTVLDGIAGWMAQAALRFAPEIVVGLPTLGHTVGAATARALRHSNWVAPSTTRKRWYDDQASVPLASITSPATGANRERRMWLDPRLMPRLSGKRVLLVDDVISTGSSAIAGLRLLRSVGIEPVALAVAMVQGDRWRAGWDVTVPVVGAFSTPLFEREAEGWAPVCGTRMTQYCPLEAAA